MSGGGAHHGGSTTMTRLGSGFLGATNVAVGGNDRIYVAEMFGNKVSLLRRGVVSTVAKLPNPASVGVPGRKALRVVRRVRQRLHRDDARREQLIRHGWGRRPEGRRPAACPRGRLSACC